MRLHECIEKGFKKFTRKTYERYNGYCFIDDNTVKYVDRDNTKGIDFILFRDEAISDDWVEYKTKVKKEGWINICKHAETYKSLALTSNIYRNSDDVKEFSGRNDNIVKIEWEEEE
jgi:hypothetical protein